MNNNAKNGGGSHINDALLQATLREATKLLTDWNNFTTHNLAKADCLVEKKAISKYLKRISLFKSAQEKLVEADKKALANLEKEISFHVSNLQQRARQVKLNCDKEKEEQKENEEKAPIMLELPQQTEASNSLHQGGQESAPPSTLTEPQTQTIEIENDNETDPPSTHNSPAPAAVTTSTEQTVDIPVSLPKETETASKNAAEEPEEPAATIEQPIVQGAAEAENIALQPQPTTPKQVETLPQVQVSDSTQEPAVIELSSADVPVPVIQPTADTIVAERSTPIQSTPTPVITEVIEIEEVNERPPENVTRASSTEARNMLMLVEDPPASHQQSQPVGIVVELPPADVPSDPVASTDIADTVEHTEEIVTEIESQLNAVAAELKASISTYQGQVDVLRRMGGLNLAARYPQGLPQLRKAMASYLTQRIFRFPVTSQSAVNEHQVFITNGAGSAIESLIFALCDSGETVLVPKPNFNGLINAVGLRTGCKIVSYDLGISTNTTNVEIVPKIDVEQIEEHFDQKTRALVITNPMNPTGTVFDKESLKALMKLCLEHRVHFICDEAWAKSCYKSGFVSAAVILDEISQTCSFASKFVHVVYSLSKDLGLAGLRVGAIYSREPLIHKALVNVAANSQVSTLTQLYASGLLTNDKLLDEYFERSRKSLADKYAQCAECFKKYGVPFIKADAGHSIVFNATACRGISQDKSLQKELELIKKLKEHRIMMLSGAAMNFESQSHGWLRMNFSAINKLQIDKVLDIVVPKAPYSIRINSIASDNFDKMLKMWRLEITLHSLEQEYTVITEDEKLVDYPILECPSENIKLKDTDAAVHYLYSKHSDPELDTPQGTNAYFETMKLCQLCLQFYVAADLYCKAKRNQHAEAKTLETLSDRVTNGFTSLMETLDGVEKKKAPTISLSNHEIYMYTYLLLEAETRELLDKHDYEPPKRNPWKNFPQRFPTIHAGLEQFRKVADIFIRRKTRGYNPEQKK